DGRLVSIPRVDGPLDQAARTAAQQRTRAAIEQVLGRLRIDLVHLHGLDFDRYLPGPGPVVLATLHLSAEWYSPRVLALARPRTQLSCVSHSQRRGFLAAAKLAVIENGVDVEALRPRARQGRHALALG